MFPCIQYALNDVSTVQIYCLHLARSRASSVVISSFLHVSSCVQSTQFFSFFLCHVRCTLLLRISDLAVQLIGC